jgi:hypothetical protein
MNKDKTCGVEMGVSISDFGFPEFVCHCLKRASVIVSRAIANHGEVF